ncbi:cytochrome c oxidase subunit VIb isoform 1, putative [Pediculus humanus corporis]|uniref:Cytochrome c oxidase subunit n=1 Tax=Pediculus humanus subsp. corporis TaxID=121224 RepID=E0VLU4_PEDHC|nr:cytochrome c oxidase subunit VIb isoform 1, putative [Pediculus humanus corporis]EEB14350.1 cytochrome c oxidase subunit VIb isoform 1, putative [Pediculus humanus corporis]
MGKSEVQEFSTAPYDPRFPNTNQTRHCYNYFVDYHRCAKNNGDSAEICQSFKKVYRSLCPNAWIEKWTTDIDEGTFPTKI